MSKGKLIFPFVATLLISQLLLPSGCFAEPSILFRIGLVLPLTGPAADYGLAIKNSIELATKDKPELFTNIRFLYEDAAYDPKSAVTAFSKLVESDKVDLSVTWGVAFCKALAPIAQTRKMPLVGICLDPTVAKNRNYILRFKNTTDEIMEVQVKYLKDRGMKRIGLLVAEHPYLQEATEAFQRHLQEGQSVTIIDRLPNNEMDLRTNILKLIKQKNQFDAIGVFLFAGQIATFYRQAHDLNFDIPTFGTDFFESLSEVKASNGNMEGVNFTSIDIKSEFLIRYRERYHNESQLAFGAPAYEFAMTSGKLFNGLVNSIAADEIIKSFSTVPPQEGFASGPYRYVNDKEVGQYFQFPVVVKKIVKDTFEIAH